MNKTYQDSSSHNSSTSGNSSASTCEFIDTTNNEFAVSELNSNDSCVISSSSIDEEGEKKVQTSKNKDVASDDDCAYDSYNDDNDIDNESFTVRSAGNKRAIIISSDDEDVIERNENVLSPYIEFTNRYKKVNLNSSLTYASACYDRVVSNDLVHNAGSDNLSSPSTCNHESPLIKKIEGVDNISGPVSVPISTDKDKCKSIPSESNHSSVTDQAILSSIYDQPVKLNSVLSPVNNSNVICISDDENNDVQLALLQSLNVNTLPLTDENNDIHLAISQSLEDNKLPSIDQKSGEIISAKMRLEYEIKTVENSIAQKIKTLQNIDITALPDKGWKIKTLLANEESNLNELRKQLDRVSNKTKIESMPKLTSLPSVNLLEMGKKALENHRVEQGLTVDSLRKLHQSIKSCPSDDNIMEDPKGLRIPLLPHQQQALTWLLWREKEKPSGGILADDMGLGKTLTMISLILKRNEIENDSESSSDDSDDDRGQDDEFQKRYHGGTLIVCPASLVGQWEREIQQRLKYNTLSYVVHHGHNREKKARRLARYDVVITSYSIIRSDNRTPNKKMKKNIDENNFSPLFLIKWERVILDEAHVIRNHKSQTASAIYEVKAKHRWALTGTPVHNKLQDFFSLIKFIRCPPFSELNVWKKWVEAKDETANKRLDMLTKSLMLRRTKQVLMSEGKLQALPEKSFKEINVHLNKDEQALYEEVLNFSKTLLSQFLYEKAEKEKLFSNDITYSNYQNKLKQLELQEVHFTDNPELNRLFKRYSNMGNVKTHEILVLLLRLRQICCHPALIYSMLDKDAAAEDGIDNANCSNIDLLHNMSTLSIKDQDDDEELSVKQQNIFSKDNPIFKPNLQSSKIKEILNILKNNLLKTSDKIVIVSQWVSLLDILYDFIVKENSSSICKKLTGKVPVDERMIIVDDFNNKSSRLQVLLLSLTAGGTGLNLVGGNHLILVDVHWNPQLEAQACDRIYRMGQEKPVTIYKLVCVETIEERIKMLQQSKLELADGVLCGSRKVQVTKLSLDDLKLLFNICN